jgi:hypothetical protein
MNGHSQGKTRTDDGAGDPARAVTRAARRQPPAKKYQWWLFPMIRNIFRLMAAKRHSCHGRKVRMKTVNRVGFVA